MSQDAPPDLFGPPPDQFPGARRDLVEEDRLGCRMCGLPTAHHDPTLIHRFVPPRPLDGGGADGTRAA